MRQGASIRLRRDGIALAVIAAAYLAASSLRQQQLLPA